MFKKSGFISLIMLMLCCVINPAIAEEKKSQDLAAIRKSGEIRIGVKTDFAPFGSLNKQGEPVGLEVDLANRLAAELGIKAKLVGVTTENRFQRLEQNAVHLIIATTGDTRERRLLATAIEPSYYGAGVNVLLRPEIKAREWADIRGMNICALQSSYFNKAITQRFILKLQVYKNINDALHALKSGQCIGFLYSDVAIQNYLTNPDWAGYNYTLASSLVAPWSMFIAKEEEGTDFDMILGDIVAKLHREGYIIELEKKWNIRSSPYLIKAKELWTSKDSEGRYTCRRDDIVHHTEVGHWPAACRDAAFITSQDVNGIGGISLFIQEKLGLNLSFLYDQYDRDRYLRGISYTLIMSVLSSIGAVLIGYAIAKMVLGGSVVTRTAANAVNFYGMMTPPLLQMYLLYFGLSSYIASSYGLMISPIAVAIFCLSFYHGAIISQALVQTVTSLQTDKPGFKLNGSSIPEVVTHAGVGIKGALNNLVKASMIASAIAVPEILSSTVSIVEDQGNVHVMMILLLVFFYVFTNLSLYVIESIEKKVISLGGAR